MAKKKPKELDVPTENMELMAGYKDDDEQIHKEVEVRELTGLDEEAIAKGDIRSNVGKIVTTLLSGCVMRIGGYTREDLSKTKWEGIFKGMFLGDRDLILLKIRETTYGTEMSFDSRCPSCKTDVKVEFDLEELEIKPLEVDPNRIPFELPKGFRDEEGNTVKVGAMRLPTGFDQEQLDHVARKNPGTANTMLITRCVYELGDLKLSSNTFRSLSSKDREYLVRTLAEHSFGPRFMIDTICDNCGNEFEAGVNPINFI